MSKYMVDGTELTRIATAIRAMRGMNMYDPDVGDNGIGYIVPGHFYTYSKDVTFDGSTRFAALCMILDADGNQKELKIQSYPTAPEAGTTLRVSYYFYPQSGSYCVVDSTSSGCTSSNIALKQGQSDTYAEYIKFVFPDGFVDRIYQL